MGRIFGSVVGGVCALMMAWPAAAEQPVLAGRVKSVAGDAFILRAGASIPIQIGHDVFESDRLRTGASGRVGLTLRDDTRVAIGPRSEMGVETFRYAPAEGRLALALRFVQGVAVYVSGKIAKLSPDAVRLQTPSAIVGVRGTTVGRTGRTLTDVPTRVPPPPRRGRHHGMRIRTGRPAPGTRGASGLRPRHLS